MTPAEIAALEALAFDTLLDFRGRDALRSLLTDYQALQSQVAVLREALAKIHAECETWQQDDWSEEETSGMLQHIEKLARAAL